MSVNRTLPAIVASALLGVTAIASLVTGAFMLFAAWATRSLLAGPASELGTGAAVMIGVLAIAFGGLAAVSARDTWRQRPHAAALGLLVGIVTILAAAATLLVATVTTAQPLLYVAIGLGAATVVVVLLDALQAPITDEVAHHHRLI
jgi:hypothetical protein